jgi:hypothetical protein
MTPHVLMQLNLTLCECKMENHFLEKQLPGNIIFSKQNIPVPLQGFIENGLCGGGVPM